MQRPQRIPPGPGQESVWDYPRPPRVEPVSKRLRVVFNGTTIAETTRGYRVLETSHPPVYYFPPDDILPGVLTPNPRQTFCEFKGTASYYDVCVGERTAAAAAWTYRDPTPAYRAIANYVAFYPSRMDACYVDDERVQAQPGDFYGGWITSAIVGPFKGGPGTAGW
ncbi:MAG: DUF427 domain-containing protein [Chloroflexota bacterium]|nr:DUF427 domain-containing protein [Dehalococcoidia bacterium]MDW8253429.1 DUF427 domain-containing protein [Chloroflexota bacterium]